MKLALTLSALATTVLCYTNAYSSCTEADPARFSVNTDQQVVTDHRTRLMWQYCANGQSGSQCENGATSTLSLSKTKDALAAANTGGFTDWRLPTVKELNSILDIRCYAPSIASNIFPNTPADYFWANNAFVADLQKSWAVSFYFGEDGVAFKKQALPSRFVRDLAP